MILIYFVNISTFSIGTQNLSNKWDNLVLMISGMNLGNVLIQVLTIKFQCKHCGSMYKTPHLDIVAGDADSTSEASKMRLVLGGKAIISPDIKQSFLFSSKTVFIFSIHSESTGPSNINHFLSWKSKINKYSFKTLLRLLG